MASNHTNFIKNSGIITFKGRKDILSNSYPCPIFHKQVWFNCAEQAYQWEKAMYHKREDIAKVVLQLKDIDDQKRCTSGICTNDDWVKSVRIYCMKGILKSKCECVSEYKQLLINSHGTLVQVDDSERFWSCGLGKVEAFKRKSSEWLGSNMLGTLHMEVRTVLQAAKLLLRQTETNVARSFLHGNHHAITGVYVNTDDIVVTVYATEIRAALAFTDDLMIPRKLVRVLHTNMLNK